ncbi:GAF domain-containing protein [Pseudonocardia humida]|uniref:GAF domain-containing protein n=1 Tax=Pseudonocardia humida TaxID=2800819 RepID=A0ABT0ZZR7_9PSEU|nr:GAF domain-containing protein [Pseudonocardia humida]MCO1656252.1 GAF domain-containing protein [Pseudonocardia humida]
MGTPAPDQTLARLLHLLATEAPSEAFDQLAEIVEAGAPGPERDEMLVAIGRAGRVRELLARRKRREKETAALVETARDLASLRDVDEVLEAIVRRARQLLGTDATYLALKDPVAGDVYMRITLGTVTRAIESVRQPLGRGVGGRIIATGRPFATADYLTDPRLDRDPAVTDAVVEDGIVSMAGVPLRVRDDVVGALFVANRYRRAFDDTEVELLTSLADHASVVIENARLFGHAEAAAGRLREANDELARQSRSLERAAAAHEQLMPLALRRADVGELVQVVAGMLGGSVAAVGADGTVSAAAGDAALHGSLHGLLPDPTDAALDAREVPDAPGTWTVPVRAGGETFGHLVLVVEGPLPDADLRTLERAAQTAALLQLMERQVSAAEQRVRGELIDDLLADREPDWAAFDRRARRSGGLDLRVPHVVLVLSADGVPRRQLLRAAADRAARDGGLATEHAARVVLLLPRIDRAVAARTVAAELGKATGGVVTAGVVGPATSPAQVRAMHREAERALRLLLALGREGEGGGAEELGVLGLVLSGTSRRGLQDLLAEAVEPVQRYDAEHNALLLPTLDAYFAAGQNPRAVARALRVHPNTVYQRLERIDRVLGHRRWREPEGALVMQVALQLRQVLEQVPLDDLLPGRPG